MKLEQFEKDDLKSLTEHRGFNILERIVKQMEIDLLSKFKKVNISDEWVVKDITNSQMMLAGAEYLINTTKAHTKIISKKKV